MKPGKVYTKRKPYPEDALLVDRTTVWGNPFRIYQGDRAKSVRKFREWMDIRVDEHPEIREAVKRLAGRDLVCWCAPLECHADYIAFTAARLADEDSVR